MAYTTDDLFRDNLLGDPNDLDNLVEFRDDANNSDAEAGGDNERGGEGDDKDDEDQEDKKDGDKKPEQKIVRIKRPQPKLDAERLKGPRGLKELRKCMSDVKFRGKGHEAEDLQRIMARMEHWSHRLFPKFQFDDFIEKVEKLGTKKVVQNYVKRMRMGILDDDDDENRPPKSDDEEAVDNPDPAANETMGEFDRLLAEQVSLHQNNSLNSTRTPGAATPRTPTFPRPGQGASSTPEPTLTPEQRARMEANRLAALERRRVRMEAAAAAAAATAAEVADAAEAADAAAAAEAAEQLSSTTSTTSNSIPVQEAGSEAPREVAGSTEDFNDSSD
ncbi:TIMELESS-interacting protein [Thrips palmi]|uniref:TIMELESS-interacting protein n=1 Tax=Thrips palmi TaxID=161013 RepID=A0A6P8Z4P6_THRPL|nr:TIMELESS-interacting protein [Thrips palmi]